MRDFELKSRHAQELLTPPSDRNWLDYIDNAIDLERQQWEAIEKQFRDVHEASLPFRFLPGTDEERAIVEKVFPEVKFVGSKGLLRMNYEKIAFADWETELYFCDVYSMQLHENGRLQITLVDDSPHNKWLDLNSFGPRAQDVLEAVGNYYRRYATAVQFQSYRQDKADEATKSSQT